MRAFSHISTPSHLQRFVPEQSLNIRTDRVLMHIPIWSSLDDIVSSVLHPLNIVWTVGPVKFFLNLAHREDEGEQEAEEKEKERKKERKKGRKEEKQKEERRKDRKKEKNDSQKVQQNAF